MLMYLFNSMYMIHLIFEKITKLILMQIRLKFLHIKVRHCLKRRERMNLQIVKFKVLEVSGTGLSTRVRCCA